MPPLRTTLLSAVAIVLSVLGGCAAYFASDEPDWIVNRMPLGSCGVETIAADGALDAGARTCLLEAFQNGDGRELISTQTTEEGDPITTYYRVHENGTVEIFVDATRDRFGSQRWQRYRCDRLSPVDDVNPDLANGARIFLEQGCEELPIP